MAKEYQYSEAKPLPKWIQEGDRVRIVSLAENSEFYDNKDILIGMTGSIIPYNWYGGAWFRCYIRFGRIIYLDGQPSSGLVLDRVCLRKLNNLTR